MEIINKLISKLVEFVLAFIFGGFLFSIVAMLFGLFYFFYVILFIFSKIIN
jgi:hypothetical protein